MIFLYVLLSVVLLSAVYLFFAPVYFEIDSTRSVYRIRLHKLFSPSFLVNDNPLLIEMKIVFWKKQIDLADSSARRKPGPVKVKKQTPGRLSFRKIVGVIKSFKVNKLEATFDLGDMQWNGILYPLFCWVSYKTGKDVRINFEGKNIVVLQIENNIARMSRAYICS